LWFKTATPFEYFNDPVTTAQARSPDDIELVVGKDHEILEMLRIDTGILVKPCNE
jgi:hypothetical protein